MGPAYCGNDSFAFGSRLLLMFVSADLHKM